MSSPSEEGTEPRFRVFAVAAGVSLVFLIDFCDWVYQCGCRSLWNGAAASCNVHEAGNHNCPWCDTGLLGMLVPPLSIVMAMAAVAWWPGAFRPASRLSLAFLMFPIMGGLTALVFALVTGYWSSG